MSAKDDYDYFDVVCVNGLVYILGEQGWVRPSETFEPDVIASVKAGWTSKRAKVFKSVDEFAVWWAKQKKEAP